jgi:hypothetical protein
MGQERLNTWSMLSNPARLLLRFKQLETRNWEISDFIEFKTAGNFKMRAQHNDVSKMFCVPLHK